MDNTYMAGSISGILEIIVTHPLDYIKTKKQEYTQKNKPFTLTLKRNYYSGIVPRVVGIIPMRMLYWGSLSNATVMLQDYNYMIRPIFTGIIVGTVQTLIDNPVELIKTRLMLNKSVTMNIVLQNKGFMATVYRNSIFASCVSINFYNTDYDKFMTSAMTGFIGSVISQPLDYVKTYQQHTNDTRWPCMKNPRKIFVGGFHRASIGGISMGIGYTVFDDLLCLFNRLL
jgi:hypothetical protein